ncbi:multidrug effflux MFS transporter [Nitratireductor sp. L1-7-SE]|uniref:Bcr/CflA family efflux transporter n=1 Tax=Nitratireductor rhodophyticola TaxID=2854036 RepID=A0ABS7R632_9HYPH|nr:multidrug effflux MFS transporter [Nitratireductor rhodophyticola]MBY8916379.1 multidrug effflux MFS transporter [Nitratireductor rhodophyticola]MBY8921742.1 multidrug effflux MFS transporter [Nitratireductor rhodophyticola]
MNLRADTSDGVAAPPLMSERRVSIIGAMLVALGPVSMALFTPAMPQIVEAFGTTEAAVKMTISLYFAGFAFAQLFCGPLSDGLGRKPVTFAFIGIYVVASFIALMSPNIETLIAARFMQGFGAAVGVAVSRAVVRDLFTQESSARIMNLIGIILAIGPAFAPTLGGFTMQLAGWHAIFVLMLGAGAVIALVIQFCMRETVVRDLSRISPSALIHSYGLLLGNAYFMLSSLVIAGAVGALYTQATVLPFILMSRVGLTPAEFGIGMLAQSGMYFAGAVAARFLMKSLGAYRLVPIGLAAIGAGSLLLIFSLSLFEPSFIGVMGPVGVYAFGIAFVMPAMMTAGLAPFPRIAGSASSLTGFLQMGTGLAGGSIAALIGDPVLAMVLIIPTLGAMAIVSWLIWNRLPEPALATALRPSPPGPV